MKPYVIRATTGQWAVFPSRLDFIYFGKAIAKFNTWDEAIYLCRLICTDK